MTRPGNRNPLRGATLIECVTAILVLGIAIPPLVSLFREVAAQETGRLHRSVALMYAESLLEEITAKDFEDQQAPSGSFGNEEAPRSAYDDVDDYDGLNNSPPRRLDGTLLADYGGFRRQVAVVNVTPATPDPAVPEPDGSTELKRITVTVDWPGGQIALTTLRAMTSSRPSPIAETLSAAAATDDNKKKIKLPLINTSGRSLLIASLSLQADVATEPLDEIKLDGKKLVKEETPLPTGVLSLADVKEEDRTVPAFESPELEIKFDSDPVGTVTYTLVLDFADGTSSTLTFTVDW